MPKDFKPPKHTETHLYVFDRKTGTILATHKRLVDAGAERGTAEISRELLESIAKDSGRATKDIDVVKAKARAGQSALRLDVKSRKVILGRGQKVPGVIMPEPSQRP
jgi:hypothetical protein